MHKIELTDDQYRLLMNVLKSYYVEAINKQEKHIVKVLENNPDKTRQEVVKAYVKNANDMLSIINSLKEAK